MLFLWYGYTGNNLACLGSYPTQWDGHPTQSNLFYFRFVFLLSMEMTRSPFFHINTQLDKVIRLLKKFLYTNYTFSVIIIWNLSIFRRELWLEVEQIYTSYWIVVMWWCDRGATQYVGSGLFILVTTLLSLRALRLVKVKKKYF